MRRIIEKHFRFSVDENKRLKDLAAKSGLTESAVIRSLLYSVVIKELPNKEFYDSINQIRKVGVNINQIAHIANATGQINVESLNETLDKLNNLILFIMKKYL